LTRHDLGRFPTSSLFDRIGRTVCDAECLPRKELYESWELARRTRRFFRGGRVVDLGGGHGLVAQLMLLLDDTSPVAVVVDTTIPSSAVPVHEAIVKAWPRLGGRIKYKTASLQSVELTSDDVVVSCHACGALTDQVIERAVSVRAPLAVLPCCHDLQTCDAGALKGWMDAPLAIDTLRALRLEGHGYRVWTQTIPSSITPKNRLLLASPQSHPHSR
jgi:hypothetical protein